jgi:hypothetical protein
MDDLPAPERPMSRTLRCLWRRLRSMVLIAMVKLENDLYVFVC